MGYIYKYLVLDDSFSQLLFSIHVKEHSVVWWVYVETSKVGDFKSYRCH